MWAEGVGSHQASLRRNIEEPQFLSECSLCLQQGHFDDPNFWPSKTLITCGCCSVQEAFRSCDDWKGSQGLAHPWLGLSSQSLMAWGSHQGVLLLPPGTSAEGTPLYNSFLSVASIPWLKYSFLYLWLSSHGILYKYAFLQKHTQSIIFLTYQTPKGPEISIISA